MRNALFISSIISIALLTGCADIPVTTYSNSDISNPAIPAQEEPDDPPPALFCSDTCEGSSECVDNSHVRYCKDTNDDGCKEWTDAIPCPDHTQCQGMTCTQQAPACADTCEINAECVSESSYRTCHDSDGDGCKEWSQSIPCQEGAKCTNGICQIPEKTCTNACNNAGDKQCLGDSIQTCGDYDADGCLEWGKDEKCEYGCDSGHCKDWSIDCTGMPICPIPITSHHQTIHGDTSKSINVISEYTSCHDFNKDGVANESGPEDYYVIQTDEPGYLAVGVSDGSKVDVDVHILTKLDGNSCVARSDKGTGYYLEPGVYYISADTYGGSNNAGEYTLQVTFIPSSSKCGMKTSVMDRRKSCGDVNMPAAGPVATEAHLVTDHDRELYDNGSTWWPSSQTDHIDTHKAYTDELFGAGTSSGDKWCPAEGGNIGSGSSGKFVPADAEAWYINMNWESSTKPKKGTKYLVIDPVSGKTVVAAAGYETGPGSCDRMGGAVYEIRKYTNTSHGDPMVFGEMNNQDFKFGPIDCFAE